MVSLRDIVVILPGITGSILTKDGHDLWSISGKSLWQIIKSNGEIIQNLKLTDYGDSEYLGDGIRPTGLMYDTHLVPGLIKIDGYTATANLIRKQFSGVIEGDLRNNQIANFFPFPYDWRRDNRINAKILQKYLSQRLTDWRKDTGAENAKIILLAHSMGGLVSRYYLEVLGGWQDCKALFTFGTPFSGSINALNFLCNGMQKYGLNLPNLTEVMRTFPSVYQLLSQQKILTIDNQNSYQNLSEVKDISLPFIDQEKLKDAFKFHEEIETAVKQNRQNIKYLQDFHYIPIVGIAQTTFHSALYKDGKVEVQEELPTGWDLASGDGDGTVPYYSAIPKELQGTPQLIKIPQRHGSLQNDEYTLNELKNRINDMQINYQNILGPNTSNTSLDNQPAINLAKIQDYYELGQPVEVGVKLCNVDPKTDIKAKVTPISQNNSSQIPEIVINKTDGQWEINLDNLLTGLYRLEVTTTGPIEAPAVQEVFEVVGGDN